MYNIILVFAALAINECQGQCHFSMCVEVSDWVQMSPADQCMQICVFQTRHGQHQIVLGLTQQAHYVLYT